LIDLNFILQAEALKQIVTMDRYHTFQKLGDGTYGTVMLGERVDTGEKVNIF